MYRQHAGPPPPDPFEAADNNAKACGHVQLGAVGMSALSVGLVAMQMVTKGGSWEFLSTDTKHTIITYGAYWIVAGGIWAGLNAWGLRRRVRLAHYSSYLFAVAMLLSCFGTVFGAGLFFLLGKKEMKGYYDARIGS